MNRGATDLFPGRNAALEESFFLGLRLNRGVDLEAASREIRPMEVASVRLTDRGMPADGMLERAGSMRAPDGAWASVIERSFARFPAEETKVEKKWEPAT